MKRTSIYIKTRLRSVLLPLLLFLFSFVSYAQVTSSIDSSSIKIGEQITLKIAVEADTTDLVVFPEGQTFLPLEAIESYKTDSTKKEAKLFLIKKYGLTQFDSGTYFIPRQKIVIGTKEFFTDSIKVEVNPVAVDTTKQKLFDIKPIIGVEKSPSKWWLYFLLIILALGLISFLVYWFVWREKPLSTEEKIALLPPYERAKLALQELDNAAFLEKDELKSYYSELTLIIRKYLDEKVYDHSLESTTEELINRLQILKDGNRIDLDRETIVNIETILKRADLVKFAKSKPDKELARIDRNTIDLEIDHVKESLPEPTEEERLADIKYQEELAKKKKRKRILITAIIAVLLLIGTVVGFSLRYGFDYVKDTVFGHPSKELLEKKEWITSEYGAPGITVTTPVVLERQFPEIPDELKEKIQMATFGYGGISSNLDIVVSTTKFVTQQNQASEAETAAAPVDLRNVAEQNLTVFEKQGVQNIITKSEQFITPNGQEGLKTFGTADFPIEGSNDYEQGNYILLGFTTENLLQQVVLTWKADDVYADEIIERVVSSIELLKLEDEE